MTEKLSNKQIYDRVKAMLPGEPLRGADMMAVICASACIDAGLSDDTALVMVQRALDSLRIRGAGEEVH